MLNYIVGALMLAASLPLDLMTTHYNYPIPITEKSDIQISAFVGTGTTEVGGSFELLIVYDN